MVRGRTLRLTSPSSVIDQMTEVEVELRLDSIRSYTKDYDIRTDSDKAILALAGTQYILALRLQGDELSTGKFLLNARHYPLATLRNLLDSLDATRRQKNKVTGIGKNGLSDTEQDLREALLSLAQPARRT